MTATVHKFQRSRSQDAIQIGVECEFAGEPTDGFQQPATRP
jgi:hypothetical protein